MPEKVHQNCKGSQTSILAARCVGDRRLPLLLLNSTLTPHSLSMSLEQSDALQRLGVNKAGVLDVGIEHLEMKDL